MKYFSGFEWAVPRSFCDAVSLCKFEEGDLLYDNKHSYEKEWAEARKLVNYTIQVRYPSRVAGGVEKTSKSVFETNWNSEVRIELYKEHKKLQAGQIRTTQGRLYTALWRGDLSVLDASSPNPKPPSTVMSVTSKLGEAEEKAHEISNGSPVFYMARDYSNSVSTTKHRVINEYLFKHSDDPIVLTPGEAGLKDHISIAPSVEIVFFRRKDGSDADFSEIVKKAVYVPTKGAKKCMFNINKHGRVTCSKR